MRSFAENRAFQTARAFHPAWFVCLYIGFELSLWLVHRLRMRSLLRPPPSRLRRGYGPWRPMLTGCGRVDAGEEKSVKNVNLLKITGISAKKANMVLLP